jgi:ParB family chromosome partitioning protein
MERESTGTTFRCGSAAPSRRRKQRTVDGYLASTSIELLLQGQPAALRRLMFLIASSVKGVSDTEGDRRDIGPIAQALNLDWIRWWQLTVTSCLRHVSKERIVELIAEAAKMHPARWPLKKDMVISRAERPLAGTGWLPTEAEHGLVIRVDGGDAVTVHVDAARLVGLWLR